MNPAASLTASRRARELDALACGETVDLVVVGGGITGAGVALDAATRGLSVALVERRDLAFGTSRWSSKLVHGGLRYLARGQFAVAYESAFERHLLMTRIAPHLARPLRFVLVVPAGAPRWVASTTFLGLRIGDGLRTAARTPATLLPAAHRVDPAAARRIVPRLGAVASAMTHWDGQLEDDARLVVAVARTASAHGARILTYCRVTSVDGDGVHVVDELRGGEVRLRARQVVVAAGVWSSGLVPGVDLRPSRGSHLVLRPGALGGGTAALSVLVPGTTNRWVFALPQPDGTTYVGLTDDEVDGPPQDEPAVTVQDEQFLLSTLSCALDRPVEGADVVGRFAGLRPLLRTGTGATSDLSRRHALLRDETTGVWTVVGGKLTTFRKMACDTVDAVAQRLGRGGSCRTASLPLVGAAPAGRVPGVPERLVRRYGSEAGDVAAIAADAPHLLQPVAPGLPVLGVELVHGVRHEGALTVDDLLDRRTRLGLVPADRAAALDCAQEVLARELPAVGAG